MGEALRLHLEWRERQMNFDFVNEALNVLAGVIFGSLGYVASSIFTSIAVGLGAMSLATAGYLNLATFGLFLAGCWFGNIGGKLFTSSRAAPAS